MMMGPDGHGAWLRRLFRRRGHRRSHRVTTITRTVLREPVPEEGAVVEEQRVIDEPMSVEAELGPTIPEIAATALLGVLVGAFLVWVTDRYL